MMISPHKMSSSDQTPRPPSRAKEKVFKYKCTFSGTVNDTMNKRGWVQVEEDSDDWDIFWCDLNQLRDLFSTKFIEDYQRVGHFRNYSEISRKNLMVKNLKTLRFKINKHSGGIEAAKLDFYPTTFILPTEHKHFVTEHQRNPGFWIIKPANGAQGRGIFIFERLKEYYEWRGKFDSPESELILRHQQLEMKDQYNRRQESFIEKNPDVYFETRSFMETMLEPPTPSTILLNNELSKETPSPTDCQDSDPGNPDMQGSSDTSTIIIGSNRIIVEPNKNDVYVVQRYISKPYLIGGRKFDIRLFVLVTSYVPMKAWMYREGFARFSRGQFSLKSLRDVYVHLTNVAIQRTSEDYDAEKGSKWSLRNLREYMTARDGQEVVQKLMNQIDTIVIRTLQSVQPQIPHDRHCFELYGFDVIIDSDTRPWLLEVNASPAFTPSNEEDYRLKCALLDDTVSILDLEGRLTGYEKRVGGYDLFWSDGPVYTNPGDSGHVSGPDGGPKVNTFLGCLNDRVAQLRTIYASAKYMKDVQRMHTSGVGGAKSTNIPLQSIPKLNLNVKDSRYIVPD